MILIRKQSGLNPIKKTKCRLNLFQTAFFIFGLVFCSCLSSPVSAIPFRSTAHACREAVGAPAHPAAKP